MTRRPRWDIVDGEGPVVAVANHAGHQLRDEAARLTALSDAERFREEDPYTDRWVVVAPTRVIARVSRFEVDLNRFRNEAFYRVPEDAWNLQLWNALPSDAFVERSLSVYDAFYRDLHRICAAKAERHGKFVVLDLHSYNHRRDGSDSPPADPVANPEVNVGTGTMVRARWASLVDRFIQDLRNFDFLGRNLDVRENVKFVGRGLPKWVHTTFPESGCALPIEVKKFFMDEWTGELDDASHDAVRRALQSAVGGVLEELSRLGARH